MCSSNSSSWRAKTNVLRARERANERVRHHPPFAFHSWLCFQRDSLKSPEHFSLAISGPASERADAGAHSKCSSTPHFHFLVDLNAANCFLLFFTALFFNFKFTNQIRCFRKAVFCAIYIVLLLVISKKILRSKICCCVELLHYIYYSTSACLNFMLLTPLFRFLLPVPV